MRTRFLAVAIVAALALTACSAHPGSFGRSAADPTTSATSATRAPLYDPSRDAVSDVADALAAAKANHHEVLLDFGADWCPDCQVLSRLFEDRGVKSVLERNYDVVRIDVGQFDHNMDLASSYVNLGSSGIPALVVIDPDGTVKEATNDGSFANARTMNASDVTEFLTKWASSKV